MRRHRTSGESAGRNGRLALLHALIAACILLLSWSGPALVPAAAASRAGLWVDAIKRPPALPRILARTLPTEVETDRPDLIDAQSRGDGGPDAAPLARTVVYAFAPARLQPPNPARAGAQWAGRLFDPRGPPHRA